MQLPRRLPNGLSHGMLSEMPPLEKVYFKVSPAAGYISSPCVILVTNFAKEFKPTEDNLFNIFEEYHPLSIAVLQSGYSSAYAYVTLPSKKMAIKAIMEKDRDSGLLVTFALEKYLPNTS